MKRKVQNLILPLLIFAAMFCSTDSADAQGCVAIRGFSGCTGNIENGLMLSKGDFLVGANYRYFKSFRHFRGHEEETNRVEEGTQVINHSSFMDFTVTYGLSQRWYANAILPFVYHTRSSMYEHGGNPPNGLGERHVTKAAGLADIRLGVGYWLFNSAKHPKFNYALGLGVKLPTGKYDAMDTFYNQGENRDTDIEKVVDQSIQPGDGGYGITTEIQGFHALGQRVVMLVNLYYLLNPQETNGVLTRNGNSEFSCPDQFAVRAGAFYMTKIHGLNAFLGARVEGVPNEDLIGSSAGYRRPGYAFSAEPGFGYNIGNAALNLTVPFALYRNRTQSYEDKIRTIETGVYRHGDAAFADYLINLSFAYRFNKKVEKINVHLPGM